MNKFKDEIYKEIKCQTAKELLEYLTSWSSPLKLTGYIFRGQQKDGDGYELIPSALRAHNKSLLEHINEPNLDFLNSGSADSEITQRQGELNLLRQFYRIADSKGLYLPRSCEFLGSSQSHHDEFKILPPTWLPETMTEIASLAQHYGIPTRLLDWSLNPYIAAYFAAEKSQPSIQHPEHDRSVIWCLNKSLIAAAQSINVTSDLKFIQPPYYGNQNLIAQSGLFTHWPTTLPTTEKLIAYAKEGHYPKIDTTPLDKQLINFFSEIHDEIGNPNIITKLTLPRSESLNLLSCLSTIGYGKSRIFPGYKGVADEVLAKFLHQ